MKFHHVSSYAFGDTYNLQFVDEQNLKTIAQANITFLSPRVEHIANKYALFELINHRIQVLQNERSLGKKLNLKWKKSSLD